MLNNSTITEVPLSSRDGDAVAPYLSFALDCTTPSLPPERFPLADVETVQLGRGEQRAAARLVDGPSRVLVLQLETRWMSRRHARLHRVGSRWLMEDQGSRNGVLVNGARVKQAELHDGDVLELGRTFWVFRAAQPAGAPPLLAGPDTVTLLPRLEAQYAQLAAVARESVPVMVLGESGVGKELAARLVHQLTGRRGPFVPVNCGGMPAALVAAQLFGHQKGAFTGASESREGYLRAAHGGTLFLDEVGELPLEAQPMLLRVLQEREVTPVGATRALPLDVQLVTATHRDLRAAARRGQFRADLLARLSGFTLVLPPLRERKEDLGLIVGRLLARLGAADCAFSLEAGHELFARRWAMNVRELEKALQVGAALAGAARLIEASHLPPPLESGGSGDSGDSGDSADSGDGPRPAQPVTLRRAAPAGPPRPRSPERDDEALRAELVRSLEATRGNVSAVAREMGKARMQIQRWLKRFGLDPLDYR